MKWLKSHLNVSTNRQGLIEITEDINNKIRSFDINEGMCFIQIMHTSASLIVTENADPTAKQDIETFLNKLVPENLEWYKHTLEGVDDSPSHMKSILTTTSISIAIENKCLHLGTWQGVYLFEHRKMRHMRQIDLRFLKAD